MTTKNEQPVAAVVVAAGSGSRLGHRLPKALVELGGTPIVRRAVDALIAGGVRRVVVVAPAGHIADFRRIFAADREVSVVAGGAERQDSVRLGLDAVGDARFVLVHDAARPLVPPRVITDVLAALRAGARAVVPTIPVIDTIRRLGGAGSEVVDRSQLRAVQTPQGFDAELLQAAHQHVAQMGITVTDDAAACEAIGATITLVEGDRESLKITEPFDLMTAAAILEARN